MTLGEGVLGWGSVLGNDPGKFGRDHAVEELYAAGVPQVRHGCQGRGNRLAAFEALGPLDPGLAVEAAQLREIVLPQGNEPPVKPDPAGPPGPASTRRERQGHRQDGAGGEQERCPKP